MYLIEEKAASVRFANDSGATLGFSGILIKIYAIRCKEKLMRGAKNEFIWSLFRHSGFRKLLR